MKRILLCLGMGVALFSATLNAQNYPSLGKIEHFKFDNSLAGELGGSIGGVTPTYVADRFGVPNKAQRFTEGTSNVVIQNFPTGTNSRTISFWFKGNTDIVQELFNVKGSTSGEMQIKYQLPDFTTSTNLITVSNGNSSTIVRGNLSYSNEWKQITIVNLSGSHRIYINGVYYAMGSNSSDIVGSPVFRIGMSNTDVVSADFDMDDLIVYNRALSDLEILQVFTAPVNAPLQEWTLFQNGPGGRTFNSLEYLKRTNPGTSNQVVFSSGYTNHSGANPVVTSNSQPRVMHETAFVTSANNTNLQVYGTDYTMDANTTLTSANDFQDETFTCGASWVLYYNTTNTQSRNGYWIGKIHRRVASPNATTAFTEVYSQAGRPLSDIESNKKFNGTNAIAVGKTAPVNYASSGNAFAEVPIILTSTNGGSNWQEIDLNSLNLGNGGLKSVTWLNQSTAIAVGYKMIVGSGSNPDSYMPLILKTTDNGLTWVDVTPNNPELNALNKVQLSNNQLWVAGDNGKLLKSTDDGNTWTMIATDVFSSVTAIYFQDAQNGIVAGTGSYVAKTTNGGQTWRRLYFQDPARITGLEFKDATNGLIQTTAGTLYQYTPCVTLTNTINATTCGSYVSPSGNQTWTTSGQYTETLTSSTGCDSVVTVNLTVISSFATTQTASACSSFTWIDGVTYTSSTNTPSQLLQSVDGCDSLVTLNLSIYNPNPATHTVSACASFTWVDGITYTSNNNTATFLLQTVNGCDSLVTLNLTINNNSGVAVETACESYTWIDNVTYTTSTNTPTFTLTNAAGCDSVVTLNLTIYNNQTGTANVTACGSYTWIDGNTYTTDNNSATHLLQTVNGCDSLVTLNLTFGTENSGTATIEACETFTWIDGNTYTSSTMTPTFTLTNQSGCDSLVTLNLTIKNSSSSVINASECASYTLNGTTYSTSGTYVQTIQNAAGCDSTITLNLTIQSNTGTATISACDSYTWINGTTYTASNNTATYTLTNAAGCDSVVTLNLTIQSVNPATTVNGTTISATQSGANYQWINCANNTPISSANSQTFTATTNGSYAVIITSGACSDTSECTTFSTIGLNENKLATFAVYPNPATKQITISNIEAGSTVVMVDVTGKVVSQVVASSTAVNIETSNFTPGVYFVSVSGLNGTQKLIIE